MKKILCIFLSVMMLFTMVGCGGKKQTAILTYNQNGLFMEYQLEAKGDDVHTITQTSKADCSLYSADQIAAIEEAADLYKAQYEAIKGVTYTAGMEGTTYVETIVIDVTKEETLTALSSQGLLPLEGTSSNISLEKTVSSLTSQGWILQA